MMGTTLSTFFRCNGMMLTWLIFLLTSFLLLVLQGDALVRQLPTTTYNSRYSIHRYPPTILRQSSDLGNSNGNVSSASSFNTFKMSWVVKPLEADYDEEDDEKPLIPKIRPGAFGSSKNTEGGSTMRSYNEDGQKESGMGKSAYLQLTPILENMVTRFAINATCFYCDMMGDQADMRWLREVKGFNHDGLNSVSWQEYLFTLMEKDSFDTYIRMPATKQALYQLIANNQKILSELNDMKNSSNLLIQSTQRIQPRKLCNQIIKERQTIIQEIIIDLQSVYNENQEAIRYATVWKEQGKQKAEKTRILCREDYEGDCSPQREDNFVEITILILNIAIDLVRADLIHKGLPSTLPGTAPNGGNDVHATLTFLDDFANQFEFQQVIEEDFFPFTTTVIEDEEKVSRSFLETLYYRGITEGFYDDKSSSSDNDSVGTVNILKLSKDLMEKRVLVAKDMISILSTLIENDESLFKMIQDRGGFKRIDMDFKPNYKIIDLEKEKRERKDHERMQALKDIETKKQQLHEERHSNSIEYDPQYDNEINNSDNVNIESIEEEDMDRNVDGFGAEGPTQM